MLQASDIRAARAAKKLRRADLAELSGVSDSTIRKMEDDDLYKTVGYGNLQKVAKVLEIE